MVVEDNSDQWLITEAAMQRCMPEVTTIWAATSEEALAYLTQWSADGGDMPKLILLDLYLPDRAEGWNLLKAIRQLPKPFSRMPVVVLSASNDPDDVTGSYREGSASYMVKPLVFDEWIQLFQRFRTYWWETVTLPEQA